MVADILLKQSVVVTVAVTAAEIRKDVIGYLLGARHGAVHSSRFISHFLYSNSKTVGAICEIIRLICEMKTLRLREVK